MSGRRVGPYRLGRRLGGGGSGDVYAVELPTWGEVALKRVPARSEVTHARALREARAVTSRRIPRVLDFGFDADEGAFYLVTDLVRGETLHQRLERLGSLDRAELSRIVDDLAEALGDLHRAGLVHRDVSPSNVIVVTDEHEVVTEAWLIDLGLVRGDGDRPLTTTGAVAGTELYLAPERLAGADATPRSDLYALATLAHDALAGLPDLDVAPSALWRDLAEGGGRRPLPSSLPSGAVRALVRGRATSPALRPPDVATFADELALRRHPSRVRPLLVGGAQVTAQSAAAVLACVLAALVAAAVASAAVWLVAL